MLESNYSYGIERDEKQLKKNNQDHRKWSNPLEVRYEVCYLGILPLQLNVWSTFSSLPHAPSMKIYCVYGHGKDTEVCVLIFP